MNWYWTYFMKKQGKSEETPCFFWGNFTEKIFTLPKLCDILVESIREEVDEFD